MSKGISEPLPTPLREQMRTCSAVLTAAQEWDRATNGRPLTPAEQRLRESVRAMLRAVQEGEAKK